MPTPRTQIVVRAVAPPGEVVEYPIDTIEWGRDAATGQWYMQIYALQPPPATTLFEVKIVSPDQKELSIFHSKILTCIGTTTLALSFDIEQPSVPKTFVISIDYENSNPKLIAPQQIASLGL
jgi:hypothetical protein